MLLDHPEYNQKKYTFDEYYREFGYAPNRNINNNIKNVNYDTKTLTFNMCKYDPDTMNDRRPHDEHYNYNLHKTRKIAEPQLNRNIGSELIQHAGTHHNKKYIKNIIKNKKLLEKLKIYQL
mgnify:CR=1 FL=1